MFTDEWFSERIQQEATEIRKRMKDGFIYGVKLDNFILKHPDVAIVYAYYLGTTDNTMQWKKSLYTTLKGVKDES